MAESPTMEVRARLTADSAQFTKGLQEASKSAENFQGAATKLNSALVGLGAVAGGTAIALIAFATKSFKAAAEVQELDIALQAIGKSTRYGYVQLALAVEAIKDVGITAAAANRAVIKLAQSNVDLGTATELATVAQNLSVTASVNAADALQTLTFAITTGQTRMLRQIGITTGATEAFGIYGRTIGKSASELSMAERRQAVLNFILKEGTKVTGAYALAIQSPSKALKEMSDLTNNLQVAVGKKLLNSFSKVILATFKLYTRFTVAANGTGTFSKFLDAMEKVLTKLADPFAKIATNLGNFIDKIDKSKISVDGIATVMEKLLPIAVGFTTFFGIKAGKSLSQAAPFFQGFFSMLSKYAGVYTLFAVALTSPQLRQALGQLVTAFKPLTPIVTNIGKAFTEISTLALGLFAAAIRGVAALVTKATKFFREHQTVTKVLAYVFGGLAAAVALSTIAFVANIAITKVATAVRAVLGVATALLSGTQLATIASTNGLAASMLRLNAIMKANPFIRVIILIAALVTAFVYAWKNSETFREVVTDVFNKVAQTVGKALAFVLTGLGNLLIAFGTAISPAKSFGQTMISVFQFIYTATLSAITGVVKILTTFIESLAYVTSEQTAFGQVVRAVLNFVSKAFVTVIGGILKFIGLFLDGLGMLLDTHGIVGKVIAEVLDFVFKAFATVVGGIIKYIGMFIEFLGNLLDTHNIVGKVIAGILDFLLDVFAYAIGGIIKFIGVFISALGNLLDTNNIVGKIIGQIFDFIAKAIFTVVAFIAKTIAGAIGILIKWVQGNREAIEKIIGLFNNLVEFIGKALSFIPNILATILEKIGSFVKKAGDFIAAKLQGLANDAKKNKLTSFLADDIEKLGKTFTNFGNSAEDAMIKLAAPIRVVTDKVKDFTSELISKEDVNKLLANAVSIKNALYETAKVATTYANADMGTALVQSISDGITKVGGFVTGIGETILSATKVPMAEAIVQLISDSLTGVGGFAKKIGETILDASDIKLGTALVQMLSAVSGTIGGAVSKVGDFVLSLKQLEVGDILGDFINSIADMALPQLEKLVNVLEGLKDVEVGKFLVENLSSLSLQAGETILGFASAVESFASGDVLGKVTDVFGSLADELKKGLGFGDILKEEKERAEELAGMNGADEDTLNELQNSADIMKKIRDAMAAGIASMRDVLADLQDAAKQFADSLKDTILSFAGLKGVELPDGFIPKAKSLIENMRMRLDKSQQFANQILTLQGLGLDAGAIKDLVESGPIKGAQLAASILGGGIEAISEINTLQKQIGFTGAAIGKFGSDAAFGQQIANAQLGIAKVVDAEARIGAVSGNNIVIEQGAFVVNVDTTGATNQDEKADIITRRIEETFAILAKQLANK